MVHTRESAHILTDLNFINMDCIVLFPYSKSGSDAIIYMCIYILYIYIHILHLLYKLKILRRTQKENKTRQY